jgi:hypothetical protein
MTWLLAQRTKVRSDSDQKSTALHLTCPRKASAVVRCCVADVTAQDVKREAAFIRESTEEQGQGFSPNAMREPIRSVSSVSSAPQESRIAVDPRPESSVAIIVPPDLIDALAAKVAELISPRNGNGPDSPWLSVVEAAKRAGYDCPNGRAPERVYALARQIGRRRGAAWIIHADDLDQAIREGRLA